MITITFWKGELFKGEKVRTVYTNKAEVDHEGKDIHFRVSHYWERLRYEKISLNHVSNSDWHQIDVLLPKPTAVTEVCDGCCDGCSHDIECER